MNPLVSIIVPVFNVQDYIEECIESIKKQNYTNIEILCVEDCSTDNSYEKLIEISKTDSRIKVFRNEVNRGLSFSRNRGLYNAKGDYIWFVDSDDYILENSVYHLVNILQKNHADLVVFNYYKLKQKDDTYFKNTEGHITITTGLDYFSSDEYRVMACLQFVKKDFLLENDLRFKYDILHEDNLYTFNLMMKNPKTIYIKDVCYAYRERIQSITTNIADHVVEKRLVSLCYIIQEYTKAFFQFEYIVTDEKMKIVLKLKERISNSIIAFRNLYKNIDSFSDNFRTDYKQYLSMFEICCAGVYDGYFLNKLMKKEMKYLREYESVLIYGSGKVGQALKKLLDERHIYVKGFTVSKKAEEIDDYSINEIGNLKSEDLKNTLVIIAKRRHPEDMVNLAKKQGIKDLAWTDGNQLIRVS